MYALTVAFGVLQVTLAQGGVEEEPDLSVLLTIDVSLDRKAFRAFWHQQLPWASWNHPVFPRPAC